MKIHLTEVSFKENLLAALENNLGYNYNTANDHEAVLAMIACVSKSTGSGSSQSECFLNSTMRSPFSFRLSRKTDGEFREPGRKEKQSKVKIKKEKEKGNDKPPSFRILTKSERYNVRQYGLRSPACCKHIGWNIA